MWRAKRVYLNVSEADAKRAETAGAKFDASKRRWYIAETQDPKPFRKWWESGGYSGRAAPRAQKRPHVPTPAGRRAMPKKFNRGRKARACRNCGAMIQFLPTSLAPRGAWIDEGTDKHHRCADLGDAHIRAIVRGEG